jgi:hypothetical protein
MASLETQQILGRGLAEILQGIDPRSTLYQHSHRRSANWLTSELLETEVGGPKNMVTARILVRVTLASPTGFEPVLPPWKNRAYTTFKDLQEADDL